MLETRKMSYAKVTLLCFMAYFLSYTMRLDLSASLLAIINDFGITKTAASYAVTGSLITYGIGQVICGILGDKISPIKLISAAMLGTVTVNVLVSFCNEMVFITVLWCFNGFFQAMIWPPLCRFLSSQTGDKYSDAITIVGLSCYVGTLFVYLVVPFILEIAIWRYVFRFMSVLGIAMTAVWFFLTRDITMGKSEPVSDSTENKHGIWNVILISGLIPIFMVVTLQGTFRDGFQTWLPAFYHERFNLPVSSSVLSSSILPVLSIFSTLISNAIYHKLKNEIKTSALLFFIASIATVIVVLGVNLPVFIVIVLVSIISACSNGVNHMIVAIAPKRFEKYGMMSTFSGIINAFVYIGSSLSTFGFAALSDNFGWSAVLISWCVVSFAGTALAFFSMRKWGRFINLQ